MVTKFLKTEARNRRLTRMEIHSVPKISTGHYSLNEIKTFLGKSELGPELAEGVYLRYEDNDWLSGRAKLVKPGFVQSIQQHWSHKPLRHNKLKAGYFD